MTERRLHVVRLAAHGSVGGVETRFLTLAKLHDRERIRVSFIYLCSGGAAANKLRESGAEVHELGYTMKNIGVLRTGFVPRLMKTLQELKPDIVHSSTGSANFSAAIALLLLRHRPSYQKETRLISEEVCIPARSLQARLRFGLAHRLSDRIVAVSAAVKDYLVSYEFAPIEKIDVIYNSYQPHFETVQTTRCFPDSPLRIVLISRLTEEKNIQLALHAISELSPTVRTSVTVTIAGDGPLRARLESLVEALGISEVVRFLGFRSDIPELLLDSDLYLMPSTTEAFGIALVEALRCGVPVLASNIGGIPEVLEGYPRSHLLAPNDPTAWANAITKFLSLSTVERKSLSQRGIELARARFSPHSYVQQLENLYTGIQ